MLLALRILLLCLLTLYSAHLQGIGLKDQLVNLKAKNDTNKTISKKIAKFYALKDHLSNNRIEVSVKSSLVQKNLNYYPFGSTMDQIHSNYGFNGMTQDKELKGPGNSYNFGARLYDSRLGRWLTSDPLESQFTSVSPYNFVVNNPVYFVDPDGRQPRPTVNGNGNATIVEVNPRSEAAQQYPEIQIIGRKYPGGNLGSRGQANIRSDRRLTWEELEFLRNKQAEEDLMRLRDPSGRSRPFASMGGMPRFRDADFIEGEIIYEMRDVGRDILDRYGPRGMTETEAINFLRNINQVEDVEVDMHPAMGRGRINLRRACCGDNAIRAYEYVTGQLARPSTGDWATQRGGTTRSLFEAYLRSYDRVTGNSYDSPMAFVEAINNLPQTGNHARIIMGNRGQNQSGHFWIMYRMQNGQWTSIDPQSGRVIESIENYIIEQGFEGFGIINAEGY